MASCFFSTVKTHSLVRRIISSGRNSVVSGSVSQRLSEIDSPQAARSFLSEMGLSDSLDNGRFGTNAVAVTEENYYGVQVVFPTINCALIPFGTVLVNCLIPDVKYKEAEKILEVFKSKVEKISKNLLASPFACITGNKTPEPSHSLSLRGFRLFYSPVPDLLFQRIKEALMVRDMLTNPPPEVTRAFVAQKLQDLKFCPIEGKQTAHTLLEDIKSYQADTVLVDMR